MTYFRKIALAAAAATLSVGVLGAAPASAVLDSGWPCGGWCLTGASSADLP